MAKKVTKQKEGFSAKGGGVQSSFQQKDQSKNPPVGRHTKLIQFIIQILVYSILNSHEGQMINRFSQWSLDTLKIDIIQFFQKYVKKNNVKVLKGLKKSIQKIYNKNILQNNEFGFFCKQILKCLNDYLDKKGQGKNQFLNQNQHIFQSQRSPGYDSRLYKKIKKTQKIMQIKESKFVEPKYQLEFQKMKGNDQ